MCSGSLVLELVSLAFDREPHLGVDVGILLQDFIFPVDGSVYFTLAKEVRAFGAMDVFDGVQVWAVALRTHQGVGLRQDRRSHLEPVLFLYFVFGVLWLPLLKVGCWLVLVRDT